MDREGFIVALANRFPEVISTIDEIRGGLLHCEMADFRRCVEAAMDENRHWTVEQYLSFLETCFQQASPELENAIGVSFLEDFALGEFTPSRHQAVRERMPKMLRDIVVQYDNRWA